MNICLESEFFEVEEKVKNDIILNKRAPFIDGVKKFISALPDGFVVHSTNFFLDKWEYSEKNFPFKLFKKGIDEKRDIGFIIKYIHDNWSKYVIAKKIVDSEEYSIVVNGMRLCDVLSCAGVNTVVNNGITFTSPMYQLMDITYNLYSPFPEIWEENIMLYKQILGKIGNVEDNSLGKESGLRGELEDYIIKNLKNIDLGLILFTDKKLVRNFGLRFISGEDIESKLFLLTRTFLDSKNEERKISIVVKRVNMDYIQYYDEYILKIGNSGEDEFPIIKVYNNLSYEVVHYSGGKVFPLCSAHILLKEYLMISESKKWSDNYKAAKKAGIISILNGDNDINKFITSPEYILKFNYAGVYKDLKIERRKHISKEYVYGEKRTFYFADF
jgi:hypothetical protein